MFWWFLAVFALGFAVGRADERRPISSDVDPWVEVENDRRPGAVDRWSTSEVARWVQSLGPAYERYADAFVANAINGTTLLTLNAQILGKLGVDNEVHRHLILTNIARLNPHLT